MKWKMVWSKRKKRYVRRIDLDIDEWVSLIIVLLAVNFILIRLLIGKL